MKKILLPGIFALAVLLIAGFGMNRSMNSYGDLSDMALKNVTALADGEDPEDPDPGEDDGDDEGGRPFWCSTATTETESFYDYVYCAEMDMWRTVAITRYLLRECDNGRFSFCYPGTIIHYYDFCGNLNSTQDQTYMSTCSA